MKTVKARLKTMRCMRSEGRNVDPALSKMYGTVVDLTYSGRYSFTCNHLGVELSDGDMRGVDLEEIADFVDDRPEWLLGMVQGYPIITERGKMRIGCECISKTDAQILFTALAEYLDYDIEE